MALKRTQRGLLARDGDYMPLRAFAHGGVYWDAEPQRLILSGALKEFFPAVEPGHDEEGRYARFYHQTTGRDPIGRSKPLGQRRVQPDQLDRLRRAVTDFQAKATAAATQPHSRVLIETFQLPDLAHDPELYRLAGPWWNRRLQILWGCERTRGSSLSALAAVAKLPVDTAYAFKRSLIRLLPVLMFLLIAIGIWLSWPASTARHVGSPNQPPLALLVENEHEVRINHDAWAQAEAQARLANARREEAETNALRAESDAKKARIEAELARQAVDLARRENEKSQAELEQQQQEIRKAKSAAERAAKEAQLAWEALKQAQTAAKHLKQEMEAVPKVLKPATNASPTIPGLRQDSPPLPETRRSRARLPVPDHGAELLTRGYLDRLKETP